MPTALPIHHIHTTKRITFRYNKTTGTKEDIAKPHKDAHQCTREGIPFMLACAIRCLQTCRAVSPFAGAAHRHTLGDEPYTQPPRTLPQPRRLRHGCQVTHHSTRLLPPPAPAVRSLLECAHVALHERHLLLRLGAAPPAVLPRVEGPLHPLQALGGGQAAVKSKSQGRRQGSRQGL